MPFLKQQIQIINAELRERCLSDKRFQTGNYQALAVDVSRIKGDKTQTFPAVMDSFYEAQPITPDDNYPIVIYHKMLGKQALKPGPSGYGDSNNVKGELVEMKMVVFGKCKSLQLTADELEALITFNFPDSIAKAKIQGLKLDTMQVNYSSSNMNAAVVFQEEYKGFELFLAPEDIMFSVRYSIESKFRKGCFTICDCESGVS